MRDDLRRSARRIIDEAITKNLAQGLAVCPDGNSFEELVDEIAWIMSLRGVTAERLAPTSLVA